MSRLDIYNISHMRKVVWKLITVIFFSFLILRMFSKNISSLLYLVSYPETLLFLKKMMGRPTCQGRSRQVS